MIKQAMILAAGEGKRMRPLTETTPKPLLPAGGKSLIEWHLQRLGAAGISNIVINVSYLGDQIEAALGDGSAYNVRINYSREPEPLETGGALNAALPFLEGDPVLLLNGDIWIERSLPPLLSGLPQGVAGHLVLIKNPPHNARGDFCLQQDRVAFAGLGGVPDTYTFSGLSVLCPKTFKRYPKRRERFPLKEYFEWLIAQGLLSGEVYDGLWLDVGTPQRLDELREYLSDCPPTQHL